MRGLHFADLPPDIKRNLFKYQFAIEFLPTIDEGALSNIFDRINRNVARLTPQELRHARFNGIFASRVEDLTDYLGDELATFPRVAAASRRQMKDAEFVAQLLLLVEQGPDSYSQDELDRAYSDRDEEWEDGPRVEREAREVLSTLKRWADPILSSPSMRRLRNQADFYSLFGAVLALQRDSKLPDQKIALANLERAMERVTSEDLRAQFEDAKTYYEAARSASNDASQRRTRVDFLVSVLTGSTASADA